MNWERFYSIYTIILIYTECRSVDIFSEIRYNIINEKTWKIQSEIYSWNYERPMHSLSLIINGTVANALAYSELAIRYVVYIKISKNILFNDNKIYLLKNATRFFISTNPSSTQMCKMIFRCYARDKLFVK